MEIERERERERDSEGKIGRVRGAIEVGIRGEM